MSKPHYTSKHWHVIPHGDGKFTIRHDSSYATSGVSELIFNPLAYTGQCCGDPADCDGCVESLALEEAAAEQAERVYVDGEGNTAPLDEVLS